MNPREIALANVLRDLIAQEDNAPFTVPLDLARVRAAVKEQDQLEADMATHFQTAA